MHGARRWVAGQFVLHAGVRGDRQRDRHRGGLARNGSLDPVQEAFIAESAIQCGFCTPGMVLAVKALLADNPNPTRAEIEQNLSSNLCRCTGYWNIIDAVERAAKRLQEGDQ
ncbi:MAG: 2Fe-2S iron-sulfur cluster-binding protein [Thermomicrobiales bacterium]